VVNNGGFEAGFSGWNVSATGFGIAGDISKAWIVGAADPNATNFAIYYGNMPHSEALAHSGDAGASAVENGSTHHRLYQDVTLPSGQVELRYWIRWKGQSPWTPNGVDQNIRVSLRDVATDNLLVSALNAYDLGLPLFSGGGDINTANYEYRTFDVSAFAGQTVRLDFRIDVQNYFLYVDLDDIEIVQLSYPAQLEVKPGDTNELQLKAKGSVPVALLSDENFDATEMVLASITLGDEVGVDTPVNKRANGTYQASFEDVNGDGLLDLVMHFDTQKLVQNGDLISTTTMLKFNGTTTGGLQVIGEDVVVVL